MSIKSIIDLINNHWENIITIFSVIITLLSILYKVKSNFTSAITNFIKEAENETNLTNPEKMDLVVSWVKDIVPRLFRVIFNDKTLRQISENIYQDMKSYRDIYIKNKTGLNTTKVIEIVRNADDPEHK